ncbi:MAG: ribosome assembly factor SBDS [Candidatus Aenigmarchaeota archaeon]|nr:ribosome assembly factor SBDS [Candidatus Aenigmarchaeota archaeon]MCX8190729.1 ribosome assembly factor SBDS [Candidatus Aenigmarchaeota archaeon]MDW8159977.1 ribosome assembly factor SBDS [Candidatus Aenigmarchaeota archaeon]
MISVDKAVVAKLNVKGINFEILVDPKKAWDLKNGKKVDIVEVLAYPAIYKNARKGETVQQTDLQKIFGTTDVYKIAEEIIKKGEFSLTTEQRREMIEEKKNLIASIISKRAINPQTNTPHPPQRILNAMDQVGVNIDPFLDAEAQVEKVLKSIKQVLPIKFQKILVQIKIPPQYIGKVYSLISSAGEIKSENYLQDGSLSLEIEIFSGVQDEFFRKVGEITKGAFESKILKKIDV